MRPLPGRCGLEYGQEREDAHAVSEAAELRPLAKADETEAELAAVLDLLWRKLHGIPEQEVTRTAARLRQASGETRAAAEALSITILRAVFTRCSAALFDSARGSRPSIYMHR